MNKPNKEHKNDSSFYLSALVGAVNRNTDAVTKAINEASANVGKWLGAIALAAANPADNSAQVQVEIDKLAAELTAGTAEVQDAINNQKKGA